MGVRLERSRQGHGTLILPSGKPMVGQEYVETEIIETRPRFMFEPF